MIGIEEEKKTCKASIYKHTQRGILDMISHKRWKQNVLIKCNRQKKKTKQTNTNDAFFFQIRSNTNFEGKKRVTIIVFPLSNAPHCHTLHRNHMWIQSILNDWWSMLATPIIIQPHIHTHAHNRRANPKKKTSKEREVEKKKCEFQRIHIYFNLNQRLDHCSSPYAFYTYSAIAV